MCGIVGIISKNGVRMSDLLQMSSALQHRGPDGFGYMFGSEQKGMRVWHNLNPTISDASPIQVGFAHRRLSVIDLSLANSQPMMDDSKHYCVTYNGEIYNYLELKRELQSLGYSFKTTGDTEVLLQAYKAWGPDCINKFNGMWAFALLDQPNNCVIFSRDRYGIKPLYYMIHGGVLYFASEIKALLVIPTFEKKANEKVVAKYLFTGLLDDTLETFYEGIFQFPAGHWSRIPLKARPLEMTPEPYWGFPENNFIGTEKDAIDHFREMFLDSVRIHNQSDVPVGTCLSGGIDSSSIVCASELLRKNNRVPSYTHSAFGYCSSDQRYSEKRFMDEVVRETSVNMNIVDVNEKQFVDQLPRIIEAQDEPFGSASIAMQWFVFQHAKAKGITVMLDGQGADETLAGYHTYFVTIALNLLAERNLKEFLALRSEYQKEIGTFPLSYGFLSLGVLVALLPHSIRNILHPAARMMRRLKKGNSMAPERISLTSKIMKNYLNEEATPHYPYSLNQELKVQVQSTCLPGLLRYEDRNSMFHSIEARVPFLDNRLVEFLFTLPEEWKIKGVVTKYILREAMKGILPETIRNRKDKIGFKASPDLTFGFVRNHFDTLIDSQTDLERQWFNAKGVEKLLSSRDQSPSLEFLLWRIVNTKLWVRQHWYGE